MRRALPTAVISAWLLACLAAQPAQAQLAVTRRAPGQPEPPPLNRTDPIAFTADRVEYDRDKGLVTASGKVEAWQNDHVLRADTITFDRNTNVAAATGNVVMLEPDGEVLFSNYAELGGGLRDGVLRGMRAILAENGKLAANGARRVEGKVNELSRAVYTTCNLCAQDPTKPPLWQIRARTAVQDTEHKKIEYRDAFLDIYGVPVVALPYFWHADPSVKRESGFLVPSPGASTQLGAFLTVPYFWAIDEVSDATITPTFNTQNYFNLNTLYRRRFNDGTLSVDGSVGYDEGSPEAAIFARGRFNYDETWRYGFDINRATSSKYLRDYRFSNRGDVLTSRIYVEGFGTGAYTKLDANAYQGLVDSIRQSRLPYVLPRYEYSYFGEPDSLGGHVSFDTTNFNVLRQVGTNTQRLGGTLSWQRPATGLLGERYDVTGQVIAAGYAATSLSQYPNYAQSGSTETARAQPQVAVKVNWPFVRDAGRFGTQTIEPIAQVIAAPDVPSYRNRRIPNEDSLDFEFTDQNLFQLNRYPGIDRVEGGVRANVGLHLNWTVGNALVDGLIGQSFRTNTDRSYPVASGLGGTTSDVITRTTVSPVPWFDVTGRTRLEHGRLTPRFADAIATVGVPLFQVSGGYIYTATNPYFLYDQPTVPASYFQHRNEATLGASTRVGYYSLGGYARRDLQTNRMVSAGVRATYEDECFIFDVNFNRRYTALNGDTGSTLILFQITFKTVGQFGFHAS